MVELSQKLQLTLTMIKLHPIQSIFESCYTSRTCLCPFDVKYVSRTCTDHFEVAPSLFPKQLLSCSIHILYHGWNVGSGSQKNSRNWSRHESTKNSTVEISAGSPSQWPGYRRGDDCKLFDSLSYVEAGWFGIRKSSLYLETSKDVMRQFEVMLENSPTWPESRNVEMTSSIHLTTSHTEPPASRAFI